MENSINSNNIEQSSTLLILDIFLQLKATQKLLLDNNILKESDLKNATDLETRKFLKPFLEKAGVSDVDNVIDTLIKNRS